MPAGLHRPAATWARALASGATARVALARATVAVDRRLALALAATLPLQALASAGFVVATGVLLGATPAVVTDGFDSHAGHRLIGGIVAVAVLVVLQEALLPVQTALAETLGRRLDARVRSRAMRAASRPPGIAHLEDPAVLAGIRDVQAIGVAHYSPGDAVVGLVGTARARLAVLAAAVLVVRFHWWIAVVLVLFGLAVRARLVRDMLRAAESAADESAALRRSDYLRDLALRPEAAKEIRVFGLARWLLRRFADERLTTMRTLWRDRKQGAATAWTWAVPWAALTGGALYLLGRAAAEGRVSLETFAIAAQATLGAAAIWTSADDLRVAYGSASLATVERLEQATRPPATPPARRLPARIPERAIELRGLSFRYPGRAREVLGGFDLVLPAGGSVAIVGRNGAGKTTLLKLLLRLYEPTSGAVLVDGRDARGFDPAAWRRRFAVVFQDFVHYELSVTRNVAPAGGADLARVREALARAGARDFVERLPHGLDTVLSRQFVDGGELSGGEWQRLAVARALYAIATGASVLVLDEPTAALDARGEADVVDRLLEAGAGLTTLLVSHRLSTIRRADRICVLEGGRIVEAGSHDELLELGRGYARMVALQASRLAPETEALHA